MLSTKEIADGLVAGESAAVSGLYREYGRMVYSVAHRTLGRADLAEDATQETMVRAWRAARRIDHSRPLAPWLATIAHRVAIDISRRETVRATVPLEETHPSTVDYHERAATAAAVHAAVDALDDDQAELARLHHFEGLTYAEVAERTNTPLGTVKSRSFRMHQQLVALLADSLA